MEHYQFTQLITKPTRITDKSTQLIDHIFTTIPHIARSTKVLKIGLNNHFPPIVVYKDSFRHKHTHISIK